MVDTTKGISGAYASLLLHQAGADVVHLGHADPVDVPAPLVPYLRQGQRTVESAGGVDVWLCTPEDADHRATVRRIRADRPGLIIVAITPYGLDGPDADRPASDLTLQADSGALAIRGNAGEEPVQMGARTIQWLGGSYAAAAALACWRGRVLGGPGALVDLSLAEVANVGGANFMDVFHAIGEGVDAEPSMPPRAYETPSIERTADGWVGFNTNAPHQLTGFLRMIGRDDLADVGTFVMPAERFARRDEWQAMVTAWTSSRTSEEVIAAALVHHVPVAPVTNGRTVAELDHVVARRSLAPLPGGGVVPRRPWRIDGEIGPDPEPPAADDRAWSSGAVERPIDPDRDPGRPLAGLRVLDVTTWWAGPAASGVLAMLGADVIHVEGTAHMDGVRMVGMSFPGRSSWWELSPFFHSVNPNKRDLAVDLTSDAGRALALRLVEQVDVVIENGTPHVLDKLGLGWDAVHTANPRTVLVRMPAFGLDGPWRDRPGFAQNIEQASGLAWLTGHRNDQPRIQRGPSDPNGGLHALIGLLSVLPEPGSDAEGHLVEAALFDAALPLASEAIVEWSTHGRLLERDGNRSPDAAPQGVYRCAGDDAWLALTVADDDQWTAFASKVLDRADLAGDPALITVEGRRARHDELDEAIAAWAAAEDVEAAAGELTALGIPAAPARDPRLTNRHPQYRFRDYQQVVDHPVTGPIPVPTQPFRLDAVDHWIRTPAPTFGQHTDEVLRDLLGLTDDELARLHEDGTIADHPVGV